MEPAESPEGVDFLTQLLVRYPEIGSACLCHGGQALRLDFYLRRRLEEPEVAEFREHVEDSLAVFFKIQRIKPEVTVFERSDARRGEVPWADDPEDEPLEVDSIQFLRDLATITVEELALLVGLVRDRYESDLALNEEAPGEDGAQQDELIHRSLEKCRAVPGEAALTGFRDDMRVLIYASQESE